MLYLLPLATTLVLSLVMDHLRTYDNLVYLTEQSMIR